MNLRLLILQLALVSCGSMTSRDRILLLDSQPRGVRVRTESGEDLGKNPIFVAGPRRDKNLLLGSSDYRLRQECRYDWWGSLVPNAVVTRISPLVGVGFFAYDWHKDNLRVCETAYRPILPAEEGQPRKMRVLILPTTKANAFAMGDIEKLLRKELDAEIVSYQDSGKTFYDHGLVDGFNIGISQVPTSLVLDLGLRFQMTHLAQIVGVGSEGIVFEVRDVFSPEDHLKATIPTPPLT